MKILVFSDSHGMTDNMFKVIQNECDIKHIIFAGDMDKDAKLMEKTFLNKTVISVLGNNDFFIHDVPHDRVFNLSGKRIFLTHGHKYHVKDTLYMLRQKALLEKADICIFGHIHVAFCETQDDIFMLNPGSARYSYAVLSIDDDVNAEIKSF